MEVLDSPYLAKGSVADVAIAVVSSVVGSDCFTTDSVAIMAIGWIGSDGSSVSVCAMTMARITRKAGTRYQALDGVPEWPAPHRLPQYGQVFAFRGISFLHLGQYLCRLMMAPEAGAELVMLVVSGSDTGGAADG